MQQGQSDRLSLQQAMNNIQTNAQIYSDNRKTLQPLISNNYLNLDRQTKDDFQCKIEKINDENQSKQTDIKFIQTVPNIVDPDPITCIIEQIQDDELGGLYLGNFEAAKNLEMLRKLKIRAVLTASIETGVKYAEDAIHFHEIFQAHDKEDYEILKHFDKSFEFIDRNRKFTNVLVHCYLGVSRSASLVISYIMKKYNMGFERALWKVKSKRRQVCPNSGFVIQLQEYELILKQNQSKTLYSSSQITSQQLVPQYQNSIQPSYSFYNKQNISQQQFQYTLYQNSRMDFENITQADQRMVQTLQLPPSQYPTQIQNISSHPSNLPGSQTSNLIGSLPGFLPGSQPSNLPGSLPSNLPGNNIPRDPFAQTLYNQNYSL